MLAARRANARRHCVAVLHRRAGLLCSPANGTTTMFGRLFQARCPVDEPTREWLRYRLEWLCARFGDEPMQRPVVCPTPEWFPERFDASCRDLPRVLAKVADRIGVDHTTIDLKVYDTDDEHGRLIRETGLEDTWTSEGAAGLYGGDYAAYDKQHVIGIERGAASDPMSAVATLAHETCHALLHGGFHLTGEEGDGERLTDLATVFFGFGIFTANSLVREANWSGDGTSGWSVGRQGYLSFPILGYALALHAHERGEARPDWARHVRPDARVPMRQGLRFLRKQGGR